MDDNTFQELLDSLRNAKEEPKHRNSKILIVDFLNTFIRAFAASPASNTNGEHCGGITGFLASVGNAVRVTGATRCIFVSDGENSTNRKKKLFPEYKSGRSMKINLNRSYNFKNEIEEYNSMKTQLVKVVNYLEHLPVQFINIDNCEADDVIAYLAQNVFIKEDEYVTIMSSDKDFYQLVNDRINIWSPTKKKFYGVQEILDEYYVHPNNFSIYKALIGDKSDSIPGVRGMGDKTIQKYFSFLMDETPIELDDFFEKVEKLHEEYPNIKVLNTILNSKDLIELNEELMQLKNPLISGNSTSKIILAEQAKPYTFNRHNMLVMSIKDGIQNSFPNISEWAFKTFSSLEAFNK